MKESEKIYEDMTHFIDNLEPDVSKRIYDKIKLIEDTFLNTDETAGMIAIAYLGAKLAFRNSLKENKGGNN